LFSPAEGFAVEKKNIRIFFGGGVTLLVRFIFKSDNLYIVFEIELCKINF